MEEESKVSGQSSDSSGKLHGTLASAPYGENYTGETVITPKAYEEQTLQTKGKHMTEDITVTKIPMWETSNNSDGYTVYIAEEA